MTTCCSTGWLSSDALLPASLLEGLAGCLTGSRLDRLESDVVELGLQDPGVARTLPASGVVLDSFKPVETTKV